MKKTQEINKRISVINQYLKTLEQTEENIPIFQSLKVEKTALLWVLN